MSKVKVLQVEGPCEMEYYVVSDNMELAKMEFHIVDGVEKLKPLHFSGEWRLKGFLGVRATNLQNLVPPEALLGENMKFKNGRGAYHAVVYDHGSILLWSWRVSGYFETEVNIE